MVHGHGAWRLVSDPSDTPRVRFCASPDQPTRDADDIGTEKSIHAVPPGTVPPELCVQKMKQGSGVLNAANSEVSRPFRALLFCRASTVPKNMPCFLACHASEHFHFREDREAGFAASQSWHPEHAVVIPTTTEAPTTEYPYKYGWTKAERASRSVRCVGDLAMTRRGLPSPTQVMSVTQGALRHLIDRHPHAVVVELTATDGSVRADIDPIHRMDLPVG